MRLRLTPRALADAKRKKTWWQRHRDAADLFEQELDAILERIAASPLLGQRVEQRGGNVWVRRWLMPKTRNHVYYAIEATEIVVLTIWGGQGVADRSCNPWMCSGGDGPPGSPHSPRSPRRINCASDAAAQSSVHNGRLLLDEPTDLPEREVYLQPVDAIVPVDTDELDDEERAALHRELEASIAEAEAGQTEDFATVIAELRREL